MSNTIDISEFEKINESFKTNDKVINEQKALFELTRKKRRKKSIFLILIVLTLISLINMVSTCIYAVPSSDNSLIGRHTFFIFCSFVAFVLACSIDYKVYNTNKFNRFLFIASFLSLLFVIIGARFLPKYVPMVNGAIGWIRMGSLFSIQPAEFIKLPFIILIAHILTNCEKKQLGNVRILVNIFPIIFVFSLCIYFENDLGTTIHYFVILLFMLFCSHISMKLICAFTGICGLVAGAGLLYVYRLGDIVSQNYKLKRIWAFLTGILKNEYDVQIGYQVGQSILAFGNGGIFGAGYGSGTQKYSYLPEIRTDFILATIGEEFGFVGMIAILIFFCFLFNLIRSTAMDAKDYFGRYLAIGIGGLLITQMLINLFVVLGLIPVFGVPMPILSYGGTSLITIFTSLGIIVNMNKSK